MKCVICNKRAHYVAGGNSYCIKDFNIYRAIMQKAAEENAKIIKEHQNLEYNYKDGKK